MDHWNTRKRVHDDDDDNDDQSECWKRSRVPSSDSPLLLGGSPATASPRNWGTLSFLNTDAASWMNTNIIGEVKNQIAQDRDSTNVGHSPSHSSASSAVSASSFGISDLTRVGMTSFLNPSSDVQRSPSHSTSPSCTLGISDINRKGMSSFLNSSTVPWGQSDMSQLLKQQWNLNPLLSQQGNKPQAADSDDMDICSSNSDSPTPTGPPLPRDSPLAPPPPPTPPPPSPLPPPPSFTAFPALDNASKEYFEPKSGSHSPGESSPKSSQLTVLLPPPSLPRLLAELAHSSSSPYVSEHDSKSPPHQLTELAVDTDSVSSPPLCSSLQSGEVAANRDVHSHSPPVLCRSAQNDTPHHQIEEHTTDDRELSPSPSFSAEDNRKSLISPTVFPQSQEYDSNSIPSPLSPVDEQFPELATENDNVYSPEATLSHELVAEGNNFEIASLSCNSSDSQISNSPLISTTPSLRLEIPSDSASNSPLTVTTPPDPTCPLTTATSPLPHELSKDSEDDSPLSVTIPPVSHTSPQISVEDDIDSKSFTTVPTPIETPESDDVSKEHPMTPSCSPPESDVSKENPMTPSCSPPEPTVEGVTCVSKLDSDFNDKSPSPKLSVKISSEEPIPMAVNRTEEQDENKQVSSLQENSDVLQSNQNIDGTNLDEDQKDEEETENGRSPSALKIIEKINELQVMPSHSYKDGCNFMKAFPPRPIDAEKLMLNVPNYWITAKDPSTFLSNYVTVGIPTCSEEYQYVYNKFVGVLPCSILAIDRVENPYSLFNYEIRKEELLKYGVDFMEFHLFHGTSTSNLVSIMETNFDWRRNGTNVGSKFGQGVSFTPNASYAVHYTDKSLELNVMILTRVLVSKFCLGDASNVLPPVGYDTTISPTGKVWVKYNNDEFYPDYLIYFKLNDMTWFEKAEQPVYPSEAFGFYNHPSEDVPRFNPGPFMHQAGPNAHQEDFSSDNFRFTPTFEPPSRRKTPENQDANGSQQNRVRGSKARRRSRRPVRNRPRRGRDLPRHAVISPELHQRSPEINQPPELMRISPPMMQARPMNPEQSGNIPFMFNQHSPPDQFQFNRPEFGRCPDEPFIFRGNQVAGIPHLSPPDQFNRPEVGRHIDDPFLLRGHHAAGIPHLSPPDQFNRPGFSGADLPRHPSDPFIFHVNNPEIPRRFSPPDQFQLNHPDFDGGLMLRRPENQGAGPFNFPGNNF